MKTVKGKMIMVGRQGTALFSHRSPVSAHAMAAGLGCEG